MMAEVAYAQAYGARNAKGDPLQTDTVMYGASITKTVMAYTALTLVDQGKLDLDAPLADYLERPLISYGEGQTHLAKYGPYRDLAGDERWRTITARMALTHSTGFHNFWFIEPDQKLRIHFDPGSRYSYSGEGFSLLQFAIEQGARTKGLGLDVKELTDAMFARLGMTRTSLQWRPDFRPNLADGWNDKGNRRSMTNAPKSASPARWTPRSATWRSSSPRWYAATACRRPRAPRWSSHRCTSQRPISFPISAPDLPKPISGQTSRQGWE